MFNNLQTKKEHKVYFPRIFCIKKQYHILQQESKSYNQSQNIVAQPLFSLKNMLTAILSPLLNVERVWKLFGIALMAAWYIWEA